MKRLSLVACFIAGTLVPSACGSDTADGDAATTSQTAMSVTGAEPIGEDGVVLFDGEGEGVGTVTQNADGTRTVSSDWGEVIVPVDPQRIVATSGWIEFESMLAVGVTPIGAGTQSGTVQDGFAAHLTDYVEGIEPLPWTDGTPTEAIAALRPDLILAGDKEEADLLSNIGSTIPSGSRDQEWRTNLRYVAAVLGRVDQAEQLIADFDARVAELAPRLAPIWDGRTVASPQAAWDHSVVYVDDADTFSSWILEELGAPLAPLVLAGDPETGIEISLENLDLLDADILFWQVRQREEDGQPDLEGIEVVTSSPLWDQLPAVQNGLVFEVDNRPWYFPTILAANQILDDVEAALLN